MIALDTNVFIRVLVGDDPEQTRIAERVFLDACRGDGVFLSIVVLAEIGWILASGYRWDRREIFDRLHRLTRTRGVFVEHPDLVASALDRYGRGPCELSDYLIAERARRSGGLPLVTFDRRLAREPGVRLLGG